MYWPKPFNGGSLYTFNAVREAAGVIVRTGGSLSGSTKFVTLNTNLINLQNAAKAWDCESYEGGEGRDKGNGWLIRHPIKKLRLCFPVLRTYCILTAPSWRRGRSRARRGATPWA